MICPNCGFQQDAGKEECERCGVIFEKYYLRQLSKKNKKNDSSYTKSNTSINHSSNIPAILFQTRHDDSLVIFIGRCILFIVVFVWGVFCLFSSPIESNFAGESFLHLVNLPFHEAGHVFFKPFGPLITSLGGTIGQLLMPLICFVALLFQTRDAFGASIALWWFGQNFFDIAPYVNDARSLSMPLVGGNFGHSSPYGFHDWEFILNETGLLQYDYAIAKLFVFIGVLIFIVAYGWGATLLFKQYKNIVD